MKSSWRNDQGQFHAPVPVEMRFIDMFMTALGSLIFLALLLVFLVRYLPEDKNRLPTPPRPSPAGLRLLTKTLPPTRVGNAYEVVLAYRGGIGSVTWSLHGRDSDIPPGIAFDPAEGTLTGTPTAPGTFRFTVIATDARTHAIQPYELEIAPLALTAPTFNRWVTVILLFVLGLFSASARLQANNTQRYAVLAQRAWGRGEKTVSIRHSIFRQETANLPDGIAELQTMERIQRGAFRLTFIGFLSVAAYMIWALWRA